MLTVDPSGHSAPVETLLADPLTIGQDDANLPAEELARRERMRETSGGITAFSLDRDGTKAVFSLGGTLCVTTIATGRTVAHAHLGGGVVDPRIDPTGRSVAFVRGGSLYRIDLERPSPPAELLASEPGSPQHISWGSADFIAGEELSRYRGYWWAPSGEQLLVQRTDESPVQTWWISDPANPDRAPIEHRYPAAGTPNALVSLHLIDVVASSVSPPRTVAYDTTEFPYVLEPSWTDHGLLVTVMNRSQTHQRVLRVDVGTGTATTAVDLRDERWVEYIEGFPVALANGTILTALDTHVGGDLPPGGPSNADLGSWADPEGTRTVVAHGVSTTARSSLGPPNLQVKH
jgi:dipeptidyl-peptidase 4